MLETLLAFAWVPVLVLMMSLGLGLLTERILRIRLPAPLIAPLGLATAICAGMAVYRLGAGAAVATPAAAVLAVAGFVVARAELASRLRLGPPAFAALAAYGLYLAPVALSGDWTWGGYNFVNDTSSHMIWADMLVSTGVATPDPRASARAVTEATAGSAGYPLGAHTIVALVQPLSGARVAAVYQPVIAAFAALGTLSLAQLATRAGLRAWTAAGAALLAIGAGLIYRYALHGGIKEIAVVALLATAAALAREALEQGLRARTVVPVAICVAALLHVFGVVSAAFAGALALAMLASALLWPERPTFRAMGIAAVVGVAAALLFFLPSLPATLDFGEVTRESFSTGRSSGTPQDLGHLLRPLPVEQTAGVWLARDYRGPVPPGLELENALLIVLAVVLALAGAVIDLARRRPAAMLLFAPAAITAAAVAPRVSPYADSKFLVVLCPAVVLLAAIGALWLSQARGKALRAAGAAAALLLAIGVFWSAALGFHSTTLAPPDRVEAMIDAADHARGGGLWLINEWEEYARYFMSEVRTNPAFESGSPRPAGLREPLPLFGRYYDLDAEQLEYVTSFPGIVKRRSPDASRPPASFEHTYRNDFYEVWRRRPGMAVREHLPLQGLHRATATPSCKEVRRMGARAADGERLVAAARSETPQLDIARVKDLPSGWYPDKARPGLVTPTSPGRVSGSATAPGGRYRVWVRGSFGRPVTARVDARDVGEVQGVNTPGQWLDAGVVTLRSGSHRLELERAGPWISPGNGYDGEIGPLALEPLAGRRLVSVAPADAVRLCGRRWDWIERVRRG